MQPRAGSIDTQMTKEQIDAILDSLSALTHAMVHSPDLEHEAKVDLLDKLCAVKREFGVVESVGVAG